MRLRGTRRVPDLLFGSINPACSLPGVFDLDEALVEVDVLPGEGAQFAEAEAGVEGGCPDRLFADRQGAAIRAAASSGRATRSRRPRTAGSASFRVRMGETCSRLTARR